MQRLSDILHRLGLRIIQESTVRHATQRSDHHVNNTIELLYVLALCVIVTRNVLRMRRQVAFVLPRHSPHGVG